MSMKLSVTSHTPAVGGFRQVSTPREPDTWKMWVAMFEFNLPTPTSSQEVAGSAIGL